MSEFKPTSLSERAREFVDSRRVICDAFTPRNSLPSLDGEITNRALLGIVLDAITTRFVGELQLDALANALGPNRFSDPFAKVAADAVEIFTTTWEQVVLKYWEELKTGLPGLTQTQAAIEISRKRPVAASIVPIKAAFYKFAEFAVAATVEEERYMETDWSTRLWAYRKLLTQPATPDMLSFIEHIAEPASELNTFRQFIRYSPIGDARVNLELLFEGVAVTFEGHGCPMNISRRAIGTQKKGEQPTPMLVAYLGLVSFIEYLQRERSLQTERINPPQS